MQPPFDGKVPRGYEPPWDVVYSSIKKNPDGMSLEDIGEVFGLTRERIRQIEADAFEKLKANVDAEDLAAWLNHTPLGAASRNPALAAVGTVTAQEDVLVVPDDEWEPSETSKRVHSAILGLEIATEKLIRRLDSLGTIATYVSVDSLREGDVISLPDRGEFRLLVLDEGVWLLSDVTKTLWTFAEEELMDSEGEVLLLPREFDLAP